MMGGKGAGLRPKSTSDITINTFFIIVKARVDNILIPTFTSCNITPTITTLTFTNTIIHMARRTRCTQQYTMVNWVMGGRVAGIGPISISTITIKMFYYIMSGNVAGIFIPRSTSIIIKY